MQLLKLKLLKGGEKGLEATLLQHFLIEEVNYEVTQNIVSAVPVNESLMLAMRKLVPHLCYLTELLDPSIVEPHFDTEEFYQRWEFSRYLVRSFSVGGQDHNGITLSGGKTLQSGKIFGFNSPFIGYDEEKGYDYMGALQVALSEIEQQVISYTKGAHAGKTQLTLNLNFN